MSRKKSDYSEKKREIADATVNTILNVGLDNCSLVDIANELGYTTGKLMYYFRDKEELLFYTKNLLFDRSWAQAKLEARKYQGVDRLVAMAMSEIPLTPEGIRRFRVLAAFKARSLSSRPSMQKQARRERKGWLHFADEIESLKKEGHIDRACDTNLAAFGIIAFIGGIAAHLIILPKLHDRKAIEKLVTEHIRAMVCVS